MRTVTDAAEEILLLQGLDVIFLGFAFSFLKKVLNFASQFHRFFFNRVALEQKLWAFEVDPRAEHHYS